MSELEFRPRFRFNTPLSPEVITQRIQDRIRDHDPLGLKVSVTGHHIVLRFPAADRHSWTPQMDLDMEVEQLSGHDPRTIVRCQIGPDPTIWMLFVGAYLALGVIALLGMAMGASQQVAGAEPWAWWLVFPTPILALVLWLLAQEGKRRAREGTRTLKLFVDDALGCDCFALSQMDGTGP